MARLEAGIYAHMVSSTGLAGLVGGTSSPRIYPYEIPQNVVLPAVTYYRISSLRHSAFVTDPNLSETRIQISCWSTTISTVQSVADQVRIAWWRYTGTTGGVTIQDIWVDDETMLYDPEMETYQMAMDYLVTHTETTS